jgi:hypothetical protein
LCRDFDEDGNLDLLLIGNLYVSEIETPRNDAGIGLYLRGNGKGFFEVLSVKESGFFAPYDAKKIGYLVGKNKNHLIVGNNNEVVQFFEVEK